MKIKLVREAVNILDNSLFLNQTLGIIDTQDVNVNGLIARAHHLGINVNVYANNSSRAFRAADDRITGQLNDLAKLKSFAKPCQWIIYVNGTGIDSHLVDYLKQFTKVPQGSDELDLINDHSILHVFLDSMNINTLPYETVFSVSDVKQALTRMSYPVVLRPVQADYLKNQQVILTDDSQLSKLSSLFNGRAYLIESLPKESRYFSITIFDSGNKLLKMLPIVENHYSGNKFNYADLNYELPLGIVDKLRHAIETLITNFDYKGALTISFILTPNHQVFVNEIDLPFTIENNIFNKTSFNVSELVLRTLLNADLPKGKASKQLFLIKMLDSKNVYKAQQLWKHNSPINSNLDPSLSSGSCKGYALLSAKSKDELKKELQESQL